ncbi:MAG: DeoR/GlpR transcriptional regulator, partial [Clostridia bacterium]|nr:DeoR/GlpR transcriptional regulator [Clostridia bacterium]
IMSIDGISASGGITTHHYSEVEVTKAMMDRAVFKVVVADSSKIGRTGFAAICPVFEIDLLITDSNASREQIMALEKAGLEVVQV